ncbi:DUF2140 family protein [Macrococcoides goetzii]|uniref:DUF2140 family protein n=2 Tax=Macrococcoides goetzii TaxID=1891097 RepID=A0A2G5NUS0_9STAP|nr:DUF2140 family protein [Macrococcus goetzii]
MDIMIKAIKHPVWFILFILLLCINIYSIFWARQIFSEPLQMKTLPTFEMDSKDTMILSEKTIKHFITMDDKNTKIKFKDHFIWIDAKSKFMTLDVQTKIKTTPKVIAPGVLALNIERIDIGRLPLSKQKALRIVDKYGNLPKEVTLDEENKRFIYTLGIQEIGDTKILLKKIDDEKAWHFDLKIKE